MESTPERDERRFERRYAVNVPATIQAKRGLPKVSCHVHDISASGAKISLTDGEPPDDFVLCLNENGTVIRICKVVWRDGCTVGVRFSVQKAIEKLIEPSRTSSGQDLKRRIAAASGGDVYPL